jgi:hypothetical protein
MRSELSKTASSAHADSFILANPLAVQSPLLGTITVTALNPVTTLRRFGRLILFRSVIGLAHEYMDLNSHAGDLT